MSMKYFYRSWSGAFFAAAMMALVWSGYGRDFIDPTPWDIHSIDFALIEQPVHEKVAALGTDIPTDAHGEQYVIANQPNSMWRIAADEGLGTKRTVRSI